MLFCASCQVKNCFSRFGEEGEYPKNCPTRDPVVPEITKKYSEPMDYLLAKQSSFTSPDHSEPRILKTMRFAKCCGFDHLGLAFCITLKEQAELVNKIFRENGFKVSSVVCKVGHLSRAEVLDVHTSCNAMCNPIAQAEFLNREKTQLNVVVGLCVGHDSLFIRHSEAPVTVLAAKDHVYDNAPLDYLKDYLKNKEEEK